MHSPLAMAWPLSVSSPHRQARALCMVVPLSRGPGLRTRSGSSLEKSIGLQVLPLVLTSMFNVMLALSALVAVEAGLHLEPLKCRVVCGLLVFWLFPADPAARSFMSIYAFISPSFPAPQPPFNPCRRWVPPAPPANTSTPDRRTGTRLGHTSPGLANVTQAVASVNIATPPPPMDVDAGIPQDEIRIRELRSTAASGSQYYERAHTSASSFQSRSRDCVRGPRIRRCCHCLQGMPC
jgi:hypothetical protein